jgi:hypothetical protein
MIDATNESLWVLDADEAEAVRRFNAGEKPRHSTGICGGHTCGYGRLDCNGYWQYSLPLSVYLAAAPAPQERTG